MNFESSTPNMETLTSELELSIKQMKENNVSETFSEEELRSNYALLERSGKILLQLEVAGYDSEELKEYTQTLNTIRQFQAEKEDYLEKRAA